MALVPIAMISLSLATATDAAQRAEKTPFACGGDVDRTLVSKAQRLFYNGDYDGTIALSDGGSSSGSRPVRISVSGVPRRAQYSRR